MPPMSRIGPDDKRHEHVLTIWDRCEMKMMKDSYNLPLKCDWIFKNLEIIA